MRCAEPSGCPSRRRPVIGDVAISLARPGRTDLGAKLKGYAALLGGGERHALFGLSLSCSAAIIDGYEHQRGRDWEYVGRQFCGGWPSAEEPRAGSVSRNALASGSWLRLARRAEPATSAVGLQDFCKPGIGTMPANGKIRGGDPHCVTRVPEWRGAFDALAEGLVSERKSR